MYKHRIFSHLLGDFAQGNSPLRSGAYRVHYLNFYNKPALDPDRSALQTKAVDMSDVDDCLVNSLQSMAAVSAKGVSWRTDMEYLITFPVRGKRSGQRRNFPLPSSWADGLLAKERVFQEVRDFYYSLVYHSFSPVISDYANFIFSYGISIVRGPLLYLGEFSDYIDHHTNWGQKDALVRGISL